MPKIWGIAAQMGSDYLKLGSDKLPTIQASKALYIALTANRQYIWLSRAQRKPQHDRDITKFMLQEYLGKFFGTSSSNSDLVNTSHSQILISIIILVL